MWAKCKRGIITQRKSSRICTEVPLNLWSNMKLHLCRVRLCETGQKMTMVERAITQKALEITQDSAIFWPWPMRVESSNECPKNSAKTLEKIHLRNRHVPKFNPRGKPTLNPPLENFRISLE